MSATAVNLGRTIVRIRDLVSLIDARPEGAKLDFPSLIRALTPSQGDLIAAVQELVDEGALDPATLRPPAKESRRSPRQKGEPGGALLAEIEDFCARLGMAVSRFGKDAVNDFSLVNRLRKGARITQATIGRVRDFIAAAACPDATAAPAAPRPGHGGEEPPKTEPEEEASTPPPVPTPDTRGASGTARKASSAASSGAAARDTVRAPQREGELEAGACQPPAPDAVTGHQLAAEIEDAACAAGVPVSAFARPLLGRHCLQRLASVRQSKRPRPETVRMIRAFIANPPAEALRDRAPLGDRRFAVNRQQRAIRKSVRTQAECFLDGEGTGKTRGGAPNPAMLAVARQIQDKRAAEARQTDPVEQAKLALQKRYAPVCSMAVHGGDPALFMVGSRRNLTRAELIELADKVGGSANSNSANQQRRVG